MAGMKVSPDLSEETIKEFKEVRARSAARASGRFGALWGWA